MNAHEALTKAAEICTQEKRRWLEGKADHAIADFDACAAAILALRDSLPEAVPLSISSALPCEACPDPPSCAEYGNCRLSAAAPLHSSTPADMVLVPREIDRSKHGKVLLVWNDCMIEHETLEMTWPKLVAAIKEQRGGN